MLTSTRTRTGGTGHGTRTGGTETGQNAQIGKTNRNGLLAEIQNIPADPDGRAGLARCSLFYFDLT